jgi:hypothetical protein
MEVRMTGEGEGEGVVSAGNVARTRGDGEWVVQSGGGAPRLLCRVRFGRGLKVVDLLNVCVGELVADPSPAAAEAAALLDRAREILDVPAPSGGGDG